MAPPAWLVFARPIKALLERAILAQTITLILD
jgi:hypothetical protein